MNYKCKVVIPESEEIMRSKAQFPVRWAKLLIEAEKEDATDKKHHIVPGHLIEVSGKLGTVVFGEGIVLSIPLVYILIETELK